MAEFMKKKCETNNVLFQLIKKYIYNCGLNKKKKITYCFLFIFWYEI